MAQRRWLMVVMAVFALTAAACGGSDDGDGDTNSQETTATTAAASSGESAATTAAPTTQGTEATQETQPPAPATPEITAMGSFMVNNETFAVTFLNRCIPFDGEDSADIDLQPIAQGQGAQLNLYGNADSLEVSVQGSSVTEIGGSIAFSADSFGDGEIIDNTIDGDRWSGAALLTDSTGGDATVDVSWDVQIPSEMNDCSL